MSVSAEDRARLVALARASVAAQVKGDPAPEPQADGLLGELRGAFVTVTNGGRLRGCIGTFAPRKPLGETIAEMGAAAAQDPRFIYCDPITPEELPELAIEVSVLSPLRETSEPLALEIGKDGIYIVAAGASGCFLPEVATDQGWDAQEFLDHCCTGKAGLPAGAWQSPDTKVYLFQSEKFDR